MERGSSKIMVAMLVVCVLVIGLVLSSCSNEIEVYQVTYDANGATGGTVPRAQEKIHGTLLTLAGNTGELAKAGYSFGGWNTQPDGNGRTYEAGSSYSENASITLYATWLPQYQVVFDSQGGTIPDSMSKIVTFGLEYGTLPTTGKDDQIFGGWYTGPNGTETLVESGTIVDTPSDHTLYAKWLAKCTVFFDSQGGTEVAAVVDVAEGSRVSRPSRPEKEGYIFGGWYLESECTTEWNFSTDEIESNMTLYARWGIGRLKLSQMIMDGEDVTEVDTSLIANMANLFREDDTFNQDISGWDVSNVTDMGSMFYEASSFNQDLSDWDVSNVTDMSYMFYYASSFNQDISGWDVSNITNMKAMFAGASSFNQDISGWDVGNVSDMSYMFYYASSFNQDISGWDVSNVSNMSRMFSGASSFNQDISDWDVGNVTNMEAMFGDASSFNQDFSGWDVSNVSNMSLMFSGASSFNQDISDWDVSNVTVMDSMFSRASSFNQDISGWNVSNVVSMGYMFAMASSFNQDISGWDVSNVTNMSGMFYKASSFNQNISGWDVGRVTSYNGFSTSSCPLPTIISARFGFLIIQYYWVLGCCVQGIGIPGARLAFQKSHILERSSIDAVTLTY